MNYSSAPAADAARDPAATRRREQALVRSALEEMRQGRADAYARVVELYQHRLFNLILMGLRDRETAEDIVQEAFIRAFTRLDAYDSTRDFYPWLATIAIRLAQNRKRRVREDVSGEAYERNASDSNVLQDVLIEERSQQLWRAVGALPAAERMTVLMYYRQDMKVEEIAQALGVTSGTIKTALFRARTKLRVAMQDEMTTDRSMETPE